MDTDDRSSHDPELRGALRASSRRRIAIAVIAAAASPRQADTAPERCEKTVHLRR